MNSTMALIINIPILFLLYVMIYFTQALSGKRQFYGVSLNSDYFTKDEFKALDKKFKLLVTLGFAIFTMVALICIYIFKAYITSSILPMFGFCIYQFLAFLHIHNKVKTLKQNLSLELNDLDLQQTKIVFDTEFSNEKNRIIKRYSILFAIPLVATILMGTYTITQYNAIPDIIPTHWGFTGEADAFSKKSFFSVFGIVFMSVGIGIITYICSVYSLKSRAKLNIDNLDKSKKANLDYLNKLAITFFILNTACQILFITILIATVNASNINTLVMWSCTVILILVALYQTYLYYKSPSKSKTALYSVDDDDNNWLFGTIYNNPNDPSLFVQKRFGVGWTVNLAHTSGKILLISPFIFVIILLIITFNM